MQKFTNLETVSDLVAVCSDFFELDGKTYLIEMTTNSAYENSFIVFSCDGDGDNRHPIGLNASYILDDADEETPGAWLAERIRRHIED